MKVKFYKALPDSGWSFKMKILHHVITLVALCYQWILVLIHILFSHRKEKPQYEVAVCMIFRNEGPFLKEWLEYHLLIGIQHFYLYNNNSTDNYQEILQPYITAGKVTLTQWPKDHAQIEAYQDCYDRFASVTKWLAYIDADEFINLQRHNSIGEMLKCYRHQPSLQMQWRDFGTSGHIETEPGELVTERYTAAWPWLCNEGKCILNTSYHFPNISVHYSIARIMGIPLYPVNDLHLPCPYFPTLWNRGVGKIVYLNHYFSRSYEWYIYKDRKREDVLSAVNREVKKNPARFLLHELNNYSHDYSIQRWLTPLILRMRKEKNDAEHSEV